MQTGVQMRMLLSPVLDALPVFVGRYPLVVRLDQTFRPLPQIPGPQVTIRPTERDPCMRAQSPRFSITALSCKKTAVSLVRRTSAWAFNRFDRIVVPERGAPIRNSGRAPANLACSLISETCTVACRNLQTRRNDDSCERVMPWRVDDRSSSPGNHRRRPRMQPEDPAFGTILVTDIHPGEAGRTKMIEDIVPGEYSHLQVIDLPRRET